MLAQYQFEIVFRPGKANGKADALTRRSGDLPKEGGDEDRGPRGRPFQAVLQHPVLYNVAFKHNPDIRVMLATDPLAIEVAKALIGGSKQLLGRYKIPFGECTIGKHGLLYIYGLLYVPDKEHLYRDIIHAHHDHPAAGHPGRAATYELVSRNYWWPSMRKTIARYLSNCDTCA